MIRLISNSSNANEAYFRRSFRALKAGFIEARLGLEQAIAGRQLAAVADVADLIQR
jgi:hypothetical protein